MILTVVFSLTLYYIYSLLLRFVDDTFDPDLGATIGNRI